MSEIKKVMVGNALKLVYMLVTWELTFRPDCTITPFEKFVTQVGWTTHADTLVSIVLPLESAVFAV